MSRAKLVFTAIFVLINGPTCRLLVPETWAHFSASQLHCVCVHRERKKCKYAWVETTRDAEEQRQNKNEQGWSFWKYLAGMAVSWFLLKLTVATGLLLTALNISSGITAACFSLHNKKHLPKLHKHVHHLLVINKTFSFSFRKRWAIK